MKTKYIISILALTVFAVGCKIEQDGTVIQSDPPHPLEVGDFLFSSYTGSITKVGLDSDISLFWTSGDRLAVYSYNGDDLVCRDVATLFSGQGSSIGRFSPETFSDNDSWYDPDAISSDYDFYAWYPTVPVEEPVSKVVSVLNVSSSQTESSGVGPYLVCWAKAETNKSTLAAGTAPSFSFAPKSSLLKLSVKNNLSSAITITSITLEADANISGDANLNLETGALGEGLTSAITYTPASPIVLAAGARTKVPVTISMLPCSATNIAVTLTDGETDLYPANIAFSGIESGKVYSKVATINYGPRRTVDIVNYTTQTASSNVLEANRLYYGKANCLVMGASETQGTLNIQLFESADGFARSDIISSFKTAVTSAKVIWAENDLYNDANFGITGADLNTLTITKSSGVTGNALVGIYDTNNDLLWSYHIWCPTDTYAYSDFESELNTNFASVYKLALGQIAGELADSYMYYQWGRKDPQGRSSTISSATTSLFPVYGASLTSIDAYNTGESSNNLAYARKNPTKNIKYVNTTLYDWYPAKASMTSRGDQEDRLWSSTGATIYDPCPEGYHVASKALWEGTTSSKSSGSSFSSGQTTLLNYVLGGLRLGSNSTLYDVTIDGYYWSAMVGGYEQYKATSLHFNSDTFLDRANDYARAHGFGVRCVRQ